jgi:hypothetical protein
MGTMSEFTYAIPDKLNDASFLPLPDQPILRVLVIGHGHLAERQAPTYEHWLQKGVEVHCADVEGSKLDDCLPGIHRHVIPEDDDAIIKAAPFDLLLINNVPELHFATALHYAACAKQIIIQKPQDLNYPLIRTLSTARGFENFRRKIGVHDHYRNKGAVPALMNALPKLYTQFGQIRRSMLFLTEHKSVNEEIDRAPSLDCGMIQDLGVHMIDLMLECILAVGEWQGEVDERLHRRIGGTIEVKSCVKMREMSSALGDDIETFSAIDLRVIEAIEFPFGHARTHRRTHEFDVLIVVGKGLAIEQGVSEDLKAVALEFERERDFYAVADLTTQGVMGFSSTGINRHHGGLNRPLMLISPSPPDHAVSGLGGLDYPQWQSFSLAEHVAAFAAKCKQWDAAKQMSAYPYRRGLRDLIRGLATAHNTIRPTWADLPPLTTFQIKQPRAEPHFD